MKIPFLEVIKDLKNYILQCYENRNSPNNLKGGIAKQNRDMQQQCDTTKVSNTHPYQK